MAKGWGLATALACCLAAPSVALHAGFNSGFDVRLAGGGNYNSGADLAIDYPVSISGDLAPYVSLGVDYGSQGGFVVGLDLLDGPNRSHSFSASGNRGTMTASNFGVFLTPGWRVRPKHKVLVEARLGLGFLAATHVIEPESGPTLTAHGMGYGVWPELRGEYELGAWGLGLSLGYLASVVPAMEDTNGQVVQDVNAGYATLHTEGFSTGLFAVYHFTPLFQ